MVAAFRLLRLDSASRTLLHIVVRHVLFEVSVNHFVTTPVSVPGLQTVETELSPALTRDFISLSSAHPATAVGARTPLLIWIQIDVSILQESLVLLKHVLTHKSLDDVRSKLKRATNSWTVDSKDFALIDLCVEISFDALKTKLMQTHC